MKRVLLLMVCVLMIASVASADFIGLFADDTGASCVMDAGFYGGTGAAIIQKYSTGTYGSRWAIQLPAGSTLYSFSTTFTATGNAETDISVGTGNCLQGDVILGHLIAQLGAGVATVVTATGQASILWLDCNFGENPGTGGTAYIGVAGGPCDLATETSTWGQVKALYR